MNTRLKLPLAAAAAVGIALQFLGSADNESSILSAGRRRLRVQLQQFNDPKSTDFALRDDAPPPLASDAPPDVEADARRPNILFLLLDQWRPDWDGHHPETATGPLPLNMPFLSELGRRGVRFTQAYVPSPFCGPSRACVASGKEYDATGVMKNGKWHVRFDTVYKLLRDEGNYHTMTCGKDDLYDADHNFPRFPHSLNFPHLDIGFSDAMRSDGKVRAMGGGDPSEEPYKHFLSERTVKMLNGTEIPAPVAYKACMKGWGPERGCDAASFPQEIYPDDFVRDEALELLGRKPGDRPWFLQVNFPGPHHPIVSTSEMAESVLGREWPKPIGIPNAGTCPQQQDENGAETIRSHDSEKLGPMQPSIGGSCNYAAELENLDRLMYTIVKRVEEMGELDNTVIFVSGDHGENLGDNGQGGKGLPWHAAVATPLFVSGPGTGAGTVHDMPVTTLDLGGTWLDYAGVGRDRLSPGMTTTSMRSILEGSAPVRPYVSSGYDNWRIVVREMPTSPDDPTPTSFKLICCKGVLKTNKNTGEQWYDEGRCKGKPESATAYDPNEPFQLMLYDTIRDPNDFVPLEHDRPDVIGELVNLLPEGWCGSVGDANVDPPVFSLPFRK